MQLKDVYLVVLTAVPFLMGLTFKQKPIKIVSA